MDILQIPLPVKTFSLTSEKYFARKFPQQWKICLIKTAQFFVANPEYR